MKTLYFLQDYDILVVNSEGELSEEEGEGEEPPAAGDVVDEGDEGDEGSAEGDEGDEGSAEGDDQGQGIEAIEQLANSVLTKEVCKLYYGT